MSEIESKCPFMDSYTDRIFNVIIFVTLLVMIGGCLSSAFDNTIVGDKQECVAVYYHEKNLYSVAIQKNNELQMVRLPRELYIITKIIQDVPENSPMWYEYQYHANGCAGVTKGFLNIHIHNIQDINTAGWNHGKFGSGTTTIIEN